MTADEILREEMSKPNNVNLRKFDERVNHPEDITDLKEEIPRLQADEGFPIAENVDRDFKEIKVGLK